MMESGERNDLVFEITKTHRYGITSYPEKMMSVYPTVKCLYHHDIAIQSGYYIERCINNGKCSWVQLLTTAHRLLAFL